MSLHRVTLALAGVVFSLLVAASASAQGDEVRGEVVQDGRGMLPSGLQAELFDPSAHQVVSRSAVAGDGSFSFSDVPSGQLWLRITAPNGEVLEQKPVVRQPGLALEIRLPAPASDQAQGHPVSETVSVARLRHKVPDKAAKEFNRSVEAAKGGDNRRAIEHLQKALRIDPEYMEAYNNLGARYMDGDRFDEAAAEFEKAAALDPDAADVYANLAGARFAGGKYSSAETAARRALSEDKGSARAHYILGYALVAEGKIGDEALQSFESASAMFPKARLMAARLLVHKGARQRAAEELRAYLKVPDVEKRTEVENWLKDLSTQQ